MPAYIIKTDKDDDFYVYWSEVTESPYYWGDREGMREYLINHFRYSDKEAAAKEADERIARAEQHGTSAFDYREAYGWDDDGILIYMQMGYLRRNQLKEFCRSYDFGEDLFDFSLLEPFEDD